LKTEGTGQTPCKPRRLQALAIEHTAPHLEGAHTILGQCDGEAVARRVEQRVVRGETPRLLRIDVTRQ